VTELAAGSAPPTQPVTPIVPIAPVVPAVPRFAVISDRAAQARLQRLEAARGFAAMYVVAHHWTYGLIVGGLNLGILFRFGQEAVVLFFLLSGFVIHYAQQQQKSRTATRYYFDRAVRIFTPLVCVLAISYLIQSLVAGRMIDPDILGLIGNLLMLQDVPELKPGSIVAPYMANSPLWSLSYEWWFYMAYFPLVSTRISWHAKSWVALVCSTAAAIAFLVWPSFPLRVVMYFAIWWGGAILATAYLEKHRIDLRDVIWAGLPISLITLILAGNLLQFRAEWESLRLGLYPILELRHFASALVILIAAIAWQSCRWVGFRWLVGPFALVAPISYGVYIVHVPILQLEALLKPIWPVARVAILIALVLIVATLVERIIYPTVRSKLLRALFPSNRAR
jgi:peptidoglycan/LPS O-acetylase OafA/YrhL